VAPAYGLYTFALKGAGDAKLEVDGKPVLDESAPANGPPTQDGARQVAMVLARGIHDVRVSGTLHDAQGRVELRWGGGNAAPGPVPANYLYNGPTGGLSAEVGPNPGSIPLAAPDPLAGAALSARRSDPALGFQEATVTFGGAP